MAISENDNAIYGLLLGKNKYESISAILNFEIIN